MATVGAEYSPNSTLTKKEVNTVFFLLPVQNHLVNKAVAITEFGGVERLDWIPRLAQFDAFFPSTMLPRLATQTSCVANP